MILKNAIRKACDYNATLNQLEYDELMKWAKIASPQGREACDALATALSMDGRPFRYVRRNEYDEKRYGKLGRVRTSSGCFITTACMREMKNDFSDNCYELITLRNFRDEQLLPQHLEEVEQYYKRAPHIVDAIEIQPNKEDIYHEIYQFMIVPCVRFCEGRQFGQAYDLYKSYCQLLEKQFLNQ